MPPKRRKGTGKQKEIEKDPDGQRSMTDPWAVELPFDYPMDTEFIKTQSLKDLSEWSKDHEKAKSYHCSWGSFSKSETTSYMKSLSAYEEYMNDEYGNLGDNVGHEHSIPPPLFTAEGNVNDASGVPWYHETMDKNDIKNLVASEIHEKIENAMFKITMTQKENASKTPCEWVRYLASEYDVKVNRIYSVGMNAVMFGIFVHPDKKWWLWMRFESESDTNCISTCTFQKEPSRLDKTHGSLKMKYGGRTYCRCPCQYPEDQRLKEEE
jgi:hypothetical protein